MCASVWVCGLGIERLWASKRVSQSTKYQLFGCNEQIEWMNEISFLSVVLFKIPVMKCLTCEKNACVRERARSRLLVFILIERDQTEMIQNYNIRKKRLNGFMIDTIYGYNKFSLVLGSLSFSHLINIFWNACVRSIHVFRVFLPISCVVFSVFHVPCRGVFFIFFFWLVLPWHFGCRERGWCRRFSCDLYLSPMHYSFGSY